MSKRLRDLPIGALIVDVDTKYNGQPIVWKIADKNHSGYPENSVTLMSDKLITLKRFDTDEKTYNDYSTYRIYNHYIYSNLLQWLNGEFKEWYKPQHKTDLPPSSRNTQRGQNEYESEAGFLSNFSSDFKKSLEITNTVTGRPQSKGTILENNKSKIFLASSTEVGLANELGVNEGSKLQFFTNDQSRMAYPTAEAVNKNAYSSSSFSKNQPWYWWIRTPINHYTMYANVVTEEGKFYGSNNVAYSDFGVRPFLNIKDSTLVKDTPENGVYEIIWNQPPSKPTSFTLPEKAISRSETEISWTKSTDLENDPISYKLERSLDGGNFVERYKGSFTRYKDIIEDKGHKAVVYRVTAIDSNGNESESLTSASLPVSDNTIPIIETASADLGKITAAYSVAYKVVDPDSGQTWTVTEKLDGKVLKTFTAKVGTSYTSKLSAGDWQKVLNGKHTLKIEVIDSDGGKLAKEISFEKAVTKLDFMLDKTGVQGIDKMPERAILSMSANVPAEASIKIEITNNGLDDKPVWQDCTAQVLGNEKIFFSNKSKTATQWAVNVRVTGDKKTATDVLSVSIIGGFYD